MIKPIGGLLLVKDKESAGEKVSKGGIVLSHISNDHGPKEAEVIARVRENITTRVT
jgi:co-chaperonin GroES (HSP10)